MKTSVSINSTRILTFALFVLSSVSVSIGAEAQEPQIMQPTKEHKMLKFDKGNWDATVKIFPPAGGAPIESKATEKVELLPGGFWMLTRFQGKIGDLPYSGRGTFGYDPTEKKFVGTWVDSMNPYMLTMKGDFDEATHTLTMTGENRGPGGKMHTSKEISRHIDANTRTFEMQMKGEDGKFQKMMEITYKRAPAKETK